MGLSCRIVGLPRWASRATPHAAVASVGRFRHRASVTTVLIVDDEPNIRTLIEQALEDLTDEGVEIVTAADGDEAIEVVRDREPRLVFLDVMMPKRNGFDVCRAIKTESARRTPSS